MIIGFSSSTSAQEITYFHNWQFRQAGTIKWYDAKVPGCIHTDLLQNGLIEDPFYRTNEELLQWIDKVNWEYKCSFRKPSTRSFDQKLLLVFEGLDTYADVYLNGRKIHSNDNMFVKSEILINQEFLKDDNELSIFFRSPVMTGLQKMQEYGLPLPADNDQSEKGGMGPNKVSIYTRKAPYQYGWDWGP
ncbi:MAG: glycosyl hydrolase 2 galactose-binding domain-containing protein, partial [Chloroflexota bacterium]